MIQRALLADRDPASLDLLSQHLQALGLAVNTVGTPEELIEQLLTTEIDIVFIDLNLGGAKAGIDAVSATADLIRGSGQTASIIVVARHLSESDQARLRSQDCHLLPKPIDPAALRQLLQHCPPAPKPEHLSATLTDLDGDELRLLQLAFIETLHSNYLDDLKSALEQHSARRAQAVLHKVKGSAGSFGFQQLGALAAVAEGLLRQGRSLDEVAAHIDLILAEAEHLQQSTNRG